METLPGINDGRSGFRRALAVALLMVIAIAVTLPKQEFSNGGENLLLTTATETRRTGRWLIPTMNSVPRVNKPPLPMWLSAMFITDATMAGLSSTDPAVREAAYVSLSLQTRWPALLASLLAVLVVYELGRTLGGRDDKIGWIAAAVCATTILFIRNARNATTDVQLMLWVSVANLLIAKIVMEGWRWKAAIGAGAAIGLGMMSKGPVALVQTLTPLIALAIWDWWRARYDGKPSLRRPMQWGLIGAGVLAALVVGLPWYLLILVKSPDVAGWWWVEVTREGATDLPAGDWWGYLVFIPWLAPWTVFFFAGLVACVRDGRAARVKREKPPRGFPVVMQETEVKFAALAEPVGVQRGRGMLLAMLMVLVPILVMSFFRDRKDRYLLPMTVPAAVVAARGVIEYLGGRAAKAKVGYVIGLHWIVLVGMTVAFPIAAATGMQGLQTINGKPWFSWPVAIVTAGFAAAVIAVAIWWERKHARGFVGVTAGSLLMSVVLFLHAYPDTDEGHSEMKPLAEQIWAKYPDATVRITGPQRVAVPPDLPLYLNRSVTWMASPEKEEPGSRPWVVVIRQRRKEQPPVGPPGWIALVPVRRDDNYWHAFVLPAK